MNSGTKTAASEIDTVKRDRIARAAETAYASIVAEVERAHDLHLPNLRAIRFTIDMSADSDNTAQAPFARYFPTLAAKPFWNLGDFPDTVQRSFRNLMAEFPAIRREFLDANTPDRYVDGHTGYTGFIETWRHRIVIENDMTFTEDARQFSPTLTRILAPLTAAKIARKSYFAMMRAGSHLPNHCGGANVYLRMHLGLVIPPGDLGLKVGGETRRWREGDILLFDDSFGHEAWNHSDQDRYILLFRFLHPDFNDDERAWLPEISQRFNATGESKAFYRALRALGFIGE